MEKEFEYRLRIRLLKKGYNLEDKLINKLKIYKELLLEWNSKINLTAITDENEIIEKHFVDCLEVTKFIKKGQKLIDVGTGAGFPGIVIAIFFDGEVDITLMDSLNKRIVFLQEVIHKLNLKNVKLVHGRVEDKAHEVEFREKFDIVVSRAVANLNSLTEYCVGYLKLNGKCLFMKADSVFEEINNSKRCLNILNCKIVDVYKYMLECYSELYTRYIVIILKNQKTINKYPRNFAKIKNSPL